MLSHILYLCILYEINVYAQHEFYLDCTSFCKSNVGEIRLALYQQINKETKHKQFNLDYPC